MLSQPVTVISHACYRISEEAFWRNYFAHVHTIKQLVLDTETTRPSHPEPEDTCTSFPTPPPQNHAKDSFNQMAAAIITIQELGEGLDLSEEERQLLREIGNDNDTIDVNNLDETDFGTCTRSP